jgi:hypothetical protein
MVASVNGSNILYSQLLTVKQTRDLLPEMNVSIAPIAFYKLNETTGTFADSSGNSRTLTASTTCYRGLDTIDTTKNLCAATLNGASTDVFIGTFAGTGTTLTGNLSMTCWLSVPSNATTTYGEFFKIGGTGKGFSIGFNNGTNNAADLAHAGRYISVGQNAISYRPTTYQFSSVAQIFHLAVTWTSGGVLTLYINGTQVYSGSGFGSVNVPTDVISVGSGESVMGFKLPMSRVAVYNGTLTSTDVAKIAGLTAIQTT